MRSAATTRKVGRWLRLGGVFASAAAIGAVALTAGALAIDRDDDRVLIPTATDAETTSVDTEPAGAATDPAEDHGMETGAGSAQCRSLLDELIAREDDGRLTDDDFPEEIELSEDEFESMEVPPTPFDGSVNLEAEADLMSFPDGVDVTTLAPLDLITGVETCEEAGILGDEAFDDEEFDDDEPDEDQEFDDDDDDELDEDEPEEDDE